MPISKKQENRPQVADCLVLLGLVFISACPYLFGLGFYGDDWEYFKILDRCSGGGSGTMFQGMIRDDSHFLLRPVQLTFFVLGFKAFGLHALPYHIAETIFLGAATIFLYLAIHELRKGRWLAFVIALVFAMLPHYSTDRLWISSHQAALSMAFALLGIYALLRSIRREGHHSAMWTGIAATALVLSILSYEIAVGLIIASIGMITWRKYIEIHSSRERRLASLGGVAGTAAVLLLVWVVKARMQTMVVYHHHLFQRFGELNRHAAVQAVLFNFWTYGLHLPSVLIRLYRDSALDLAAMGAATIIVAVVMAYLWSSMEPAAIPTRRISLWLIVIGFIVFALGYGLFFPDPETDFSTSGIGNRIVMVSAVGASCVLVAVASLACSILKNDALRVGAFSVVIGAICGANCLAVSGIAHYWDDAALRQSAILKSVAANVHSLPLHSLPHGSVVLLDGFCSNSGPASVFSFNFDTSGALDLALNDDSLVGDAVSRYANFGPSSVDVALLGHTRTSYPYGDRLFIYNVARNFLTSLPSHDAAQDYLHAMNPAADSVCPAGLD